MRLEARVLEGGQTATCLVPLVSLTTFKADTGNGVDWWIHQSQDPDTGVDFVDWEPKLTWQTMTDRRGETREFAAWLQDIEWAGIYPAADELDPSGGEAIPTPESSPASSSTPAARGSSSSGSTTSSKPRSGTKSGAK